MRSKQPRIFFAVDSFMRGGGGGGGGGGATSEHCVLPRDLVCKARARAGASWCFPGLARAARRAARGNRKPAALGSCAGAAMKETIDLAAGVRSPRAKQEERATRQAAKALLASAGAPR